MAHWYWADSERYSVSEYLILNSVPLPDTSGMSAVNPMTHKLRGAKGGSGAVPKGRQQDHPGIIYEWSLLGRQSKSKESA